MSCTCSAERNVRLVVTGKRFKVHKLVPAIVMYEIITRLLFSQGKTYINSELRMLRMKEEVRS
eukprot:102844-Amorphochlora_amoeboformis.AAC.1